MGTEVEALRAELQSAQEKNTSLEAEKASWEAARASWEATRASLEAERVITERKSIDRALYNVWKQDPNFDFSSFGEQAVARAAWWSAHYRRP